MVTHPSISDSLSIQETIERLQSATSVDGIAEFGSRAANHADPASDYDLLLLVNDLPARVFQMVTSIDGQLADIVLVETATADALLAADAPPAPKSFEGLFVNKMRTARILYDASNRLTRVQAQVNRSPASLNPATQAEQYDVWFWSSFGLIQLERMAQSQDPLHLNAVDMMLTAFLPGTWRSYFDVRGIAWQGEKAALRYWTEHDPAYMDLINYCLANSDRRARLVAYRELVERTLAPIGVLFGQGETAVVLMDSSDPVRDANDTLKYWDGLFRVGA